MKTIFTIIVLCITSLSNAQFISEDDMLHFTTGAIISSTTYTIVYSKTKNKKKAFLYSLGLSTLTGLTKEIFDEFVFGGRFDTGEFISTVSGGLVASYTFNILTGKKIEREKRKMNFP
ncbi:MAG: hypothetical protein KJN66_04435 [Bacteroidia bacterium]|nr:hypothetical protein [Bacteroidia bacterium]